MYICMYIYIYIYVYRERDICLHITLYSREHLTVDFH